MKIGIDFDGVISDCGDLKSVVAEKLYGIKVPSARFKKELILADGILTLEQYRQLQKLIYGTREYGFLMKPVEGALKYIALLTANGHSVVVITSRQNKELEVAREWCEKIGLSIKFIGVGYGNPKTDAARGLDVFVDDDLDKLEPLEGIVPHLFLFRWGYNAHIDPHPTASLIHSRKELHTTICELS